MENQVHSSSAPDIRSLGVTLYRPQNPNPYSASRAATRICDLYLLALLSSNRISRCTATSSVWNDHRSSGLYHRDIVRFLSRACPLSIDTPSYTRLTVSYFAGSILYIWTLTTDGWLSFLIVFSLCCAYTLHTPIPIWFSS